MKYMYFLLFTVLTIGCGCICNDTPDKVVEPTIKEEPVSQRGYAGIHNDTTSDKGDWRELDVPPPPPMTEPVVAGFSDIMDDIIIFDEPDFTVTYIPSVNKYKVRLTDAYPDKLIMYYLVQPTQDDRFQIVTDSLRPNGTSTVEWLVSFDVDRTTAPKLVVTSNDKRWSAELR